MINNAYNKYRVEIKQSIDEVITKISKEKKERQYISRDKYLLARISDDIIGIIKCKTNEINLVIPPEHTEADLALVVFNVAKNEGENPAEVAKEIAKKITGAKNEWLEKAEPIGPYVNLYLAKNWMYPQILNEIIELGEKYGESDKGCKKTMVVDFSHPNIAKPIGVGHMRSTIIGEALKNLYIQTGYSVIADNHLGDWGTQFGALIYAFKNWGDEDKIKKNPINELKELYVRFHKEAAKNPALKDEARKIFYKLEQKDDEIIEIWEEFRNLGIEDFNKIYEILDVKFDTYIGESYFADESERIVNECVEKKLAKKESNGAISVELEGLPSFLIQKEDGASLYMTRDLATIKQRVREFGADEILYVVGVEQELHFRQLFELSRKMGYLPDRTIAKHIKFGLVLADGKKMSTREGTVVELEELINKAIEKSRQIIKERNPDIKEDEIEEIARIVGIGAIIYNDLGQSLIKNITFDWNKMFDFEGGSAAYLQYSCVRINSILKKLGDEKLATGKIIFENESEWDLAKKLAWFSNIILEAKTNDAPHILCNYLEELAQLFSNFYEKIPVVKSEGDLRSSRIALIKATALILKKGLGILNIRVPERM